MQMPGLSHRLWRCSCPESLAPTHPFLSHPCLRSWPWASCKYPLYCGTSAALTGCRALPVRCLMMHLGKAKKWDKGRSWESSSVNVRAVMMSIQASLMQSLPLMLLPKQLIAFSGQCFTLDITEKQKGSFFLLLSRFSTAKCWVLFKSYLC